MEKRNKLLHLITNRNFLLLASVAFGLVLGRAAHATERLTLPALAAAMTVTTTQIGSDVLRPMRRLLRFMLLAILLNYGLLSGLTLALARLWRPDRDLWIGFVLVAAVPAGVAVIPFSTALGGDVAFALVGSVGVYLAALLFMPGLMWLLVGEGSVQPGKVLIILLQLVVIPLLLSRIIRATRLRPTAERWRGSIVNWAFALVIFTVVGLNRDLLLRQPQMVLFTALIAFAGSFGLGAILEVFLQRRGVLQQSRVSYVLMATLKNTGLAAATALALYGERASLPAVVISALNVLYLVWADVRWGTKRRT